jgi:D-alanyl-D-alanine carboxypeptidase
MNLKVKELGLTNTHFENPQGLDGSSQFTTVRDLMTLTKYALERPLFAEIVKTKIYEAVNEEGTKKHKMANLNELLGSVDGVLGVKTGWTENAKENLVTYVDRDGKKIIIVLLGSNDRFGETKSLIDWVYNNYVWQEV